MTAFLCLRRGGLGDTLLMIPVLRAMRAADPSAELHFAGVAEHAVLLQHYEIVDRVWSSEDLGLWALGTEGERATAARARLARYAWIVADDPLCARSGAARVQVLDPRIGDGSRTPAAAQLLQRLALPPGIVGSVDPRPWLQRRAITTALPRDAVLHPGSGGARKCWPWERWLDLAVRLQRLGWSVTVALGAAENARVAAPLPSGVARFSGHTVLELAARLETAAVFAGNDSGVTHLAAALQVPTVAVFGPTDPRVWAPTGAHVTVVAARARTEGPPGARVADVCRAVVEATGR